MRYLITGGAGFIGSHLAEALLQRGDEVLVLDDLSTGCYENLAPMDDGARLRLVVGSINDPALVAECVKEVGAVFHLASAVGVRLIIEQPVRTIESIVLGTDIILKSCARYRRPVLITSTSEVYGRGTKCPFGEDDDRLLGPTTLRRWSYACAKALDEYLGLAHWYETRLPVVIARLFNTVGPRQTGQYGMVIPRFVQQGLRGESLTVFGDGQQSRCFCHVKDVVACLVQLLDHPGARGQVFNVGSDQEITVLELAERIRHLTGMRSAITFIPYHQAYGQGFDDMQRRVPDLTKIRKFLGFQSQSQLDQILTDIVQFETRRDKR